MANDKYVKLIKQYSEDGGNTWYDSNPPEYKRGDLIEKDSPDCGAAVLQYRWFAKGEDYYTCEGYNKYYKEWYQYSYDGTNWFDVEPEQTRTGSLIEQNSIDCDYGIEWIPVEGEYICYELQDGCYFTYSYISNEVQYPSIGFSYNEDYANNRMPINKQTEKIPFIIDGCTPFTYLTFNMDDSDKYLNYVDISTLNCSKMLNFNYMFLGCNNLEEVNLTNIVLKKQYIDFYETFYNCNKLKKIDGLETINFDLVRNFQNCFYNCSSIEELIFSDTLNNLTNCGATFRGCSNLKKVVFNIKKTNTHINLSRIFDDCSSLTDVVFGSFITDDISYAFNGCSSLTELTFNNCEFYDKVQSNVGMVYTFNGCSSLTELAFNNCIIQVDKLYNTFNNCSALTKLLFDNTLLYVSENIIGAFNGCSSLTELTLPFTSKVSIDMTNAFNGCSSLTSIDFGSIIGTDIDLDAFKGCTSLTRIVGTTSLLSELRQSIDSNGLPEVFRDPYYEGWVYNDI